MADFEPWTAEPTGPAYCYVVRQTGFDGESAKAFKWPGTGYIECPDWGDGQADPAGTQFLDLSTIGGPPVTAWKYDGPGLWGWLHGGRWPKVCFNRLFLMPRYQVLTVARSELREGCAAIDEFRAPRAWVKYSGPALEVAAALDSEGTHYARLVRKKLTARAAYCQSLARQLLHKSTYDFLYAS